MTSSSKGVDLQGFVAPGFEAVGDAFERNFVERGELGASFAAHVCGETVVDVWGGLADRDANVPWQSDTLVGIFSGSKGLVATCLLLLLERGALELDAPVCHYWPQFAANGKRNIRVRDVVSHQAGLPGLATPVSVEEATNDVRMAQLVAQQATIAPPGSSPIYHAMTFGWMCGELVRRVDGRSIGTFLRDEIAAPLGLEVWIGLPERYEHRVAVLERDAAFQNQHQLMTEGEGEEVDPVAWSIWWNPPRFSGQELAANERRWHAAEIPATNGIVSARSMSRLYGCLALGGEIDGVRLVSPPTIQMGRSCLAYGHDPYLNSPIAFGIGFEVQTSRMELGPAVDAFGHAGAGGSAHGAWPSLRTGFSYAPNLLSSLTSVDPRTDALLRALHASVCS